MSGFSLWRLLMGGRAVPPIPPPWMGGAPPLYCHASTFGGPQLVSIRSKLVIFDTYTLGGPVWVRQVQLHSHFFLCVSIRIFCMYVHSHFYCHLSVQFIYVSCVILDLPFLYLFLVLLSVHLVFIDFVCTFCTYGTFFLGFSFLLLHSAIVS